MISAMLNYFSSLPRELTVLIVSAMPVLELRGAIPIGLSMGLEIKKTMLFSIIGNLMPVVPVLFLLEPVSGFLRRFWPFSRFFHWLFERTRRRSELIERYEFLGLMLFVAIPLPVTGAWTGCVAATLFKIRFRYAFSAIFLGICIASVIVSAVCLMGGGILYRVFIPHFN
jgi:uncharacterized membrane protein